MALRMLTERGLKVQPVPKALVVPFGAGPARGISRPAGVFTEGGMPVGRATCWRDSTKRVTVTPPLPLDVPDSWPGTWLYGGMLYAHFGHFLCESTGRLWALDGAGERIDGVVFLPKKEVTREKRFLEPVLPWLRIAGVTLPVRLALRPVRVERLLVPDQGFGTGDMVTGAPEFHAYAAARFGRDVAAAGPERIYISRTRLFSRRGRILAEAALEARLEAEGYTVFHPQEHPIEVQIAQYKAARRIISTDCSALHLAAFFGTPDTRVAIIARRPGEIAGDFVAQYRGFSRLDPLVVNAIARVHAVGGATTGPLNEVYSEVDYGRLWAALTAAGLVTGAPPKVTRAAITAELDDLAARIGAPVAPMTPVA